MLGPLLFLLYEVLLDCLQMILLFHILVKVHIQCTIEDVINSDLESISIWSKKWLVNFNPQKTKAMVFSNINLPNDVEITFQDKLVEFVTSHKHLGITFDSNAKFHTHIVNVIKSANQRLCALRKLKYVLDRHFLTFETDQFLFLAMSDFLVLH